MARSGTPADSRNLRRCGPGHRLGRSGGPARWVSRPLSPATPTPVVQSAGCCARGLAPTSDDPPKELDMNAVKVAAIAALLVSAPAFGADPSTDKQENALPEFSTLDANGDGAISNEESREQSWVASRFGELDG